MGTILSMPLSGIMSKYGFDGGWASVFYCFGERASHRRVVCPLLTQLHFYLFTPTLSLSVSRSFCPKVILTEAVYSNGSGLYQSITKMNNMNGYVEDDGLVNGTVVQHETSLNRSVFTYLNSQH